MVDSGLNGTKAALIVLFALTLLLMTKYGGLLTTLSDLNSYNLNIHSIFQSKSSIKIDDDALSNNNDDDDDGKDAKQSQQEGSISTLRKEGDDESAAGTEEVGELVATKLEKVYKAAYPDFINRDSGLYIFDNALYDELVSIDNKDHYYYKNRTQYPQVSFDSSGQGQDVILMFESKNDFFLFWNEPDFSNAIVGFQYREIPCNNHGVKSCTITLDRKYMSKAHAIVQIAALNHNPNPTVPILDNQAYVGFYTELDDSGCRKRAFDAKLSYSPDATIRYNDNCNVVKLMYKCMGRAVHIMSNKEGLTQKEINRWKRKLYQYCVQNPDVSEQDMQVNAMSYSPILEGDVAIVVSNCIQPRANFIEALVTASTKPNIITTHSYGKCKKNFSSSDDKLTIGKKHKFLFSMENTMKRDYVSEKIFQAFRSGSVPIYQGAQNIFDYAPNGSFVGVHSFAKPEALVDYLTKLSKDEEAYDEFFDWDFDSWLQRPHTIQCLQIEVDPPIDAGWCSICDWAINVFPHMKKEGKKNCDKIPYAPYFGYPRNPLAYKEKYK